MNWINRIAIVSFLIILCINSLSATTLTDKFNKTINFQHDGNVKVKSLNGQISITSWNRDVVDIEAEIRVKASGHRNAENLLKNVKINIEQHGDRLYIEADYPRRSDGSGLLDWIFGRNANVTVNYWLKVPQKTNVDLKSVNGRISVEEIEGIVELNTTNGSIDADNIQGSLSAHTTNGSIKAHMKHFPEDDHIHLKTVNGGVKLFLPPDVQADVYASTVNGSVNTDFPLTIRGKFIKRKVEGKINNGGGQITLSTVNGSINLYEK